MIHKLYFLLLLSFLSACTFTENDSIEPAYLILQNPSLTTKSSEGDNSHNIKYAWVIIDGQLLGVFPLPAKVPIIPTSAEMDIQINAGVNQDGDPNNSVEYPFFNPIKKTMKIESNEEYDISLKFTYKSDLVFDFIEGFENNTHILDNDIDENTNTRINLTGKDKVSGNSAGIIVLDNANTDGEVSCIPFFDNKLNKLGNVFLEFDYKSDESIFVGSEVEINNSSKQSYSAIVPKSTKWTRAYVNLTQDISRNTVSRYRVILGSTRIEKSNPQSEIYFDNVKLVHF
jgi:hypothetical protein